MKGPSPEFRFRTYDAMKIKKTITVICEGQSEIAYINSLNRFFREEEIDWVLNPVKAVNGQYREIRRTYNALKRTGRKARIEILVDRDIYIREEKERDGYRNREKDGLPFFRFSYMNFEDFLILHLPRRTALRWSDAARSVFHDVAPLAARDYLSLLSSQRVWRRRYKKGRMPFRIDWQSLDNLIRNDSDGRIFMHSDFTDLLIEILPSG